MRISVYPADNHGCGNYRLKWPGQVLAEQGHDVVVNPYKAHHDLPIQVFARNDDLGNPVVQRVGPIDADVVVMQRQATENSLRMIEMIQDQGVKVVMDIDDALWAIDKGNVSWNTYNHPASRANWKWLLEALRAVDLVVGTTAELVDEFDGVVVPNFIPAGALEVGRWRIDNDDYPDKPADVTVGWAATILTHPKDPSVTNGQVAEWVRNNDARFLSVGGRDGREPVAFGFDEDDHEAGLCEATGEIQSTEWFRAVGMLDVSLVPLADTHFNRCKSRLKMLESAAAGCAIVASPTPDNALTHEMGIGVLAGKHRWERRIRQVVAGGVKEQAAKNWEIVKDLTIEENAGRWLEAWSSA